MQIFVFPDVNGRQRDGCKLACSSEQGAAARAGSLANFITLYAHAGGSKPVCVCQGRRAWLPPASMWLFPPRSAQHTIGGWYFEWPGQLNASHPLCALGYMPCLLV